jgi:hypothetical protein
LPFQRVVFGQPISSSRGKRGGVFRKGDRIAKKSRDDVPRIRFFTRLRTLTGKIRKRSRSR